MLSEDDVCAAIVTYNPDDDALMQNIAALVCQVAHLVIVDNGSMERKQEKLTYFSDQKKVTIIFNAVNKGLAFALNQGLEFAYQNNYKLFLTMDQDSKLGSGSVRHMIDVLNIDRSIISVGPNYMKKRNLGTNHYTTVDSLITSGNLVCTEKAIGIGGYNNELFIDSVDFDFSLSLRANGQHLALVYNAEMEHKIGESENTSFLFWRVSVKSHSPARHYYIYRNHYYLLKKYLLKFPLFCLKKELFLWIYSLELLSLHSRRVEKLIMIYEGVKDAIQSKYGPYTE